MHGEVDNCEALLQPEYTVESVIKINFAVWNYVYEFWYEVNVEL